MDSEEVGVGEPAGTNALSISRREAQLARLPTALEGPIPEDLPETHIEPLLFCDRLKIVGLCLLLKRRADWVQHEITAGAPRTYSPVPLSLADHQRVEVVLGPHLGPHLVTRVPSLPSILAAVAPVPAECLLQALVS
jgi:hypothetical protein